MYDDAKAGQLAEARRSHAINRALRGTGELPSIARKAPKGLTEAQYARWRSNDLKTVRQAIVEGRITPNRDGTIDAAKADRQWAERTNTPTGGIPKGDAAPPPPASLAAARRRKLVASVEKLELDVGALRAGLLSNANAERIIQSELAPVVARLRRVPAIVAPLAAGLDMKDAALVIQSEVNRALKDITSDKVAPPTPDPCAAAAPLAPVTIADWEARKNSLLAERTELDTARRSRELVPLGDVLAKLDTRLADARGAIMSLAGRVAPRCRNADAAMVDQILASEIEAIVTQLGA